MIRVNLPNEMGLNVIYPQLLAFQSAYPDIILDLHFNDRVIDLLEHRFDLGIGNNINQDSRLIARPLYKMRMVTVASRDYLDGRPTPRSPQALSGHNCIAYRSPSSGRLLPWIFSQGDNNLQFVPAGNLIVNSSSAIVQSVLRGQGIATLPWDYVSAAVAEGRCIRLLAGYEPAPVVLWLYYPS